MKVIEVNPRGFCHGVVTAMQIVTKAANDDSIKKPLYIVGDIVHNKNVSKAYEQIGVITLNGNTRREIIETIDSGTVILTAHGTDPNVIKYAKDKGLNIIDATCCDVTKTHNIINEHLNKGFDIIYVGKKSHPEPEAAVGINKQKIHLIEDENDLNELVISNENIILTNQTTLSMWDLNDLINKVIIKYPQVKVIKEICDATKLRQEAVLKASKDADLTIVVGDPKSNNTNKLAQISNKFSNKPSIRIASLNELDVNLLIGLKSVAVTSGASTPSLITKDVINFLKKFDENDESTYIIDYKIQYDRLIPKAKK